MNKDIHHLFESYKAIYNEDMPYPEFAKLSKHAASKLPEDKPKEKLKYTYEIVAYLPRDIDISTREGQDKVLSLAYKELVKRVTNKYKNPERAASNMFYDEDFPMELVSQYSHYQKHGFPEVEDDFREQMPDSREEYSAHDYAKEMETKGEDEERRLDSSCWSGYHKAGTKMKGGVRVNNCVKNEQEETDYKLPSLYQFHKMLQNFDSTYEYSDDPSAYRRGRQQHDAISKAIEKGGKPYQDLYDKMGKEDYTAPQKSREEVSQDADTLNAIAMKMKEVTQTLFHDIDEHSVTHPQQLWDIYYPAFHALKAIKSIAEVKNFKHVLKSLADHNI